MVFGILLINVYFSESFVVSREYSKEPRLAGTEQDAVLAQRIHDDWKANGLEEVHLATYNILLSFPNTSAPNLVKIFSYLW